MNYVENVSMRVNFAGIGNRKPRPIFAEYGCDYGYDLYKELEYSRTFVRSTDFVVRSVLLKKKIK